jgi:MFS family permease
MAIAGTSPGKPGRQRYYRILIPVCLTFFVTAIDRANIAVAVPTIAIDFQLSTAVVGVVLSAFFWGYVPVQLPGAVFGQYVNAKWLITGALGAWALGTALTGISSNLDELIAFRVLVGVSEGAAVPTLLVLIRRWFPLEERARATSAFFIFGQAGNLVGSVATGVLIAVTSWPTMFFIEAIPPLIVAVIVAIWLTDDPDRDQRLGEAERRWLLDSRTREAAETGTLESARWTTVVRSPLLWAFVIVWMLSSVGSYGLQTWVPTVIKEVTRIGIGNVGLLSAIPYLIGIVLLYCTGYASDRLHRRDVFIFIGFVLAGLAIFFGPDLPAVWKLTVIFLGAGCNAAITGIIVAWLEDLTPRAHVGIAIGTIQFFGQMAGIGAPLAVGFVAGTGPATGALWIIGVGLLLAAFVTVLIYIGARRRMRQVPAPPVIVPTH